MSICPAICNKKHNLWDWCSAFKGEHDARDFCTRTRWLSRAVLSASRAADDATTYGDNGKMDRVNLSGAGRPGLFLRILSSECRSPDAAAFPIWWAISIARSPECVSWWSIHFRSVIMCIRLLIWKTLNSSIFRSPFSNSPHWEEPWGTPKNHT